MIRDLPSTLAVDILAIPAGNIVRHNGQVFGRLVTEEPFEEGADDGLHAGGKDDDGDVVLLGPVVELLEEGVQLHVLQEGFDALVVRGLDARKHLTEGITKVRSVNAIAMGRELILPESQPLLENLLVQNATSVTAEAQVIDLQMLAQVIVS